MTELIVATIAVAILIWWPLLTLAAQTKPKLKPGNPLQLEALGAYDRKHRTGALFQSAYDVALPFVALFALLHGMFSGGADLPLDALRAAGAILVVGTWVARGIGYVLKTRMEKKVAREHPELSGCVYPGQILRGQMTAKSIVVICLLLAIGSKQGAWSLLLAATVFHVFGDTILTDIVSKYYLPLPDDSPLALTLKKRVARLGFQVTSIKTISSSGCFAFASQTRSVHLSTALTRICTEEEIAAVVTHEFGHIRLNQTDLYYNISKATQVGLLLVAALTGWISARYLPSKVDASILTLSVYAISSWLIAAALAPWTRDNEFKCDQYVADQGLGRELAQALVKISRYNGSSADRLGVHRFVSSHPSLRERVEHLGLDLSGLDIT